MNIENYMLIGIMFEGELSLTYTILANLGLGLFILAGAMSILRSLFEIIKRRYE